MVRSFIKSFFHVVKKWEFQTAKFHLKTESFSMKLKSAETEFAIKKVRNWKNDYLRKCVYNAVEKVPDARPHFEKENPLTK